MSRPFERSAPWRALAVVLGALAGGCGGLGADSGPRHVPAGAFAVVGERALGLDLLRRAADERDPLELSRLLIDDALFAQDSSTLQPERAAVVERGALVRGLLEVLRQQALLRTPVHESELDLAAKSLWAELDRPRCVRTVSVTASVPPLADGQREERVLRRIAEEVRGAGTPEELAVRVQRVPTDGADVSVVLVPPVTEDGRLCTDTPADATLPLPPVECAAAAARLTYIGETSEVVSTPVGYHVLMALDILPPHLVSEPERSRRLRSAVADRRIQADLDKLRRDLSARVEVWQNPHRAALTSLVWRAPRESSVPGQRSSGQSSSGQGSSAR